MEQPTQNYSYDVIVLSQRLQNPKVVDGVEADRTYSVRLVSDFVDLTPNRILAEYFPSRPLGELLISSCDLISSLKTKGICVTVYDNEDIVGSGNVMLSDHVLRNLTIQTFKTNEVVNVSLQKKNKPVGSLQLKIKLSSVDPDLDTRFQQVGCYDVCRPLDKSVNPKDVIFTLGRSSKCAATTCITDQRLMSHAGAPFNCAHAKAQEPKSKECSCLIRGVKPPPELNQEKERDRTLLKKLLAELDIDREHIPTPPSGHALSRKKRCKCRKSKRSAGSCSSNSFVPMWSDALGEEEELYYTPQHSSQELLPHQLKELEANCKRARSICPAMGQSPLLSTKYRPPIKCPVCNANITWLPKLAACPYCGYRQFNMNRPSEEPFDETATADHVLRSHFLQSRFNSNSEVSDQYLPRKKLSMECTCGSGRVCTRCRVRQLCEQMCKMSSRTKMPSLPAAPKGSPEKVFTEPQRREQLLNIFTELSNVCGKAKESKGNQAATICKALRKKAKGKKIKLGDKMKLSKKQKICKVTRRSRAKRYTFLVRKEPQPASRHQLCARDSGRVPCNMGWRWTSSELARYRYWKPGAISKSIRALMTYFLKDYPLDTLPIGRRCRRRRGSDQEQSKENDEEANLVQHPTLHIKKKHDEYTITMRPLKDPKTLTVAANPYASMKPVVFRIVKDPSAAGERQIKISLKDMGFHACSCGQPIARCCCRSHNDQKIVEHMVDSLAKEHGWQGISESFVFSDLSESDSENEFDFGVTPPAGIVKPERLHRPDKAHTETQYNTDDWALPTMYPHPPSALVQYGGCVVGERMGKFPWLMGKGYVHREPKPKPKKIRSPKSEKQSKGRQKGGQDNVPANYLPFKRNWHKSNAHNRTSINYSNGPLR